MSEPFSIRKENREGQLLIVLNGRLDAYWSTILSEEIDVMRASIPSPWIQPGLPISVQRVSGYLFTTIKN